MYRSVKRTWFKWFALAFVAGFLFPYSYGRVLQADVLSSSYDSYELADAIKAYHLKNNTLVNAFLSRLLEPESAEDIDVSYPADEAGCEGNASTYCLALALNENLTEFETYLQSHQNELSFDSEDSISLPDAFEAASNQRGTVDDQILAAENTLDLTLAIYNQVQLIYPVHKELLALIENLEEYRSNLADIRSILTRYPSKFNGASTAQCK